MYSVFFVRLQNVLDLNIDYLKKYLLKNPGLYAKSVSLQTRAKCQYKKNKYIFYRFKMRNN